MTPERAKALEAVAKAALAYYQVRQKPQGQLLPGEHAASRIVMERALAALDALPAEPADAGGMVEVRAAVLINADGQPSLCDITTGQGVRTSLNSWLRNGFQHIATITARIPRPVVPEVRAEVET